MIDEQGFDDPFVDQEYQEYLEEMEQEDDKMTSIEPKTDDSTANPSDDEPKTASSTADTTKTPEESLNSVDYAATLTQEAKKPVEKLPIQIYSCPSCNFKTRDPSITICPLSKGPLIKWP